MGAFDLFAMTSNTEQMPYAILEAMAARLPIASTAVGDIPVMVAEENRPFIVPADDGHKVGLALAQLCNDTGLRHRVGKANRKRVEQNYPIKPMVDAFQRTIAEVIGTGSPLAAQPNARTVIAPQSSTLGLPGQDVHHTHSPDAPDNTRPN